MPHRMPNRRLMDFNVTIFAEMSALATRTGAINLGQGFPDTDGPPQIIEAAIRAMRSGYNQYPPATGYAQLREAIAGHQLRFYGLDLDPDTEVLVTTGATEAIAATLLALCEPGDEVVMLEPYYDSYAANVAMAGARRVMVTLRAPEFRLDTDALREAISPRTRLILLNSPHNPTGRVLSHAELIAVATVAREHDLLVVADEVHEHLTYDSAAPHIPIATLPGMRERTVSISSAAKTFSVTGWKVGWLTAPAELVAAIRTVKQYLTFVSGAPFQPAVAQALALPDSYFAGLRAQLRRKRDLLCEALAVIGFDVFCPQGTYFITTDIRPLGEVDGIEFCRTLPGRCGVVAVPDAVFYDDAGLGGGRPLVRFAFCKRDQVLHEAIERLAKLRASSISAV
jgi:N-succinyldiaminopimelate aminotransferase